MKIFIVVFLEDNLGSFPHVIFGRMGDEWYEIVGDVRFLEKSVIIFAPLSVLVKSEKLVADRRKSPWILGFLKIEIGRL